MLSTSNATKRLLKLSLLPGVGTASLVKVAKFAQDNGLSAIEDDEKVVSSFAKKGSRLKKSASNQYVSILENCEKYNIKILSILDKEYPKSLTKISSPPSLLYLKGDLTTLNQTSWAVVGTRKASKLGLDWARQISEILAEKQICVVSGLAIGIDTSAHQGALDGKGKTIAVLANGLDQVLPKKNTELALKIIENGGALISTLPPKSPISKPEFIKRNRIQSGLSKCSIIVESSKEGGTMHHGNFAFEQGHPIYCIKPSKSTNGFKNFDVSGANQLVKEKKAKIIRSSKGLLKLLK